MATKVNLKELSKKEEILTGGHRACAGCGCSIALRQVTLAAERPIVVGAATGCMEVVTTIYPYTAWRCPYIHNAFENVAATISGAEAAFNSLKKQGKIDDEIDFIAFGGDGGTYDIGLQSLSGAMERGHRMLYVCYNNEAYMNTGIQRSGATPRYAATTTAPAGKAVPGKTQGRKNLTEILVAHGIPYVAQSSIHAWRDLMTKVRKALDCGGPAFINVLGSCNRGWRVKMEDSISICELAFETCAWPMYEVENGVYTVKKPKEKKPLTDWLKAQGRYSHLFKGDHQDLIDEAQQDVDREWERLLMLEKVTQEAAKAEA
jgi:pyruvate ferredoxin oxidoreductase beta subunit